MTPVEKRSEVFAETRVDGLEGRFKLARHRGVQLGDDGAQVQGGLVHIGDLRGEELEACACLLVLAWRVGIAAAQRLETTAQAIDTAAQFAQLRLLFLRKLHRLIRRSYLDLLTHAAFL